MNWLTNFVSAAVRRLKGPVFRSNSDEQPYEDRLRWRNTLLLPLDLLEGCGCLLSFIGGTLALVAWLAGRFYF